MQVPRVTDSNSNKETNSPEQIWAIKFDGNGSGQILPDTGTANPPAGKCCWYHLHSDSPNTRLRMSELGLHEDTIDALTATNIRPRTLEMDGGLLVILRGVNTNSGADPEDMVAVRLWITDKLIISARKKARKLLSVVDIHTALEKGIGPKSVGEFMAMLVQRLADRIGDTVDEIDEGLTEFETSVGDTKLGKMRSRLSSFRRQTAAIRRHLAPQRDALEALYRLRGPLSETEAIDIREESDRIIRYVEELDLAKERSLVLQEEIQNRTAEQQNERMYVLSIVAAIFLPLSFLTGVFGMNVAGLPGTENSTAFVILSYGMLCLAILMLLFMRWRKWL